MTTQTPALDKNDQSDDDSTYRPQIIIEKTDNEPVIKKVANKLHSNNQIELKNMNNLTNNLDSSSKKVNFSKTTYFKIEIIE